MGSHFHECIFFNRAEFLFESLEWDLTFFLDLGDQKRQVGKDLKMGRFLLHYWAARQAQS